MKPAPVNSVEKRMNAFLLPLLAVFLLGFAQDPWKDVYKEAAWKERDAWQKAGSILWHLNLKPGQRAADIGCHEGYMTVKLSAEVGAQGKVYAVDISQAKLDKLKTNLEARKITNVISVLGESGDPRLPPNSMDAVLVLDTYHEMKSHDKILQQIKLALKTSGRLVICEPIADARRKLSREVQERKHELDMNFAVDDLRSAGFQILFKRDPFVDREKIKGDKMWIVVAVKPRS